MSRFVEARVEQLAGRALNWALAEVVGEGAFRDYCTDWAVGGPLIDSARILFYGDPEGGGYVAYLASRGTSGPQGKGATHLLAGVRCLVNAYLADSQGRLRVPAMLLEPGDNASDDDRAASRSAA